MNTRIPSAIHTSVHKDREDLFTHTPPLEAKRALFSRAATMRKRHRCKKLLFIAARKTHLKPKCTEDVSVASPDKAGAPSGVCGKLNFWLYGFRLAASASEKNYSELLEGVGFERGKASPVVFHHPQWDLACVVHGDDFAFEGYDACLDWIGRKWRAGSTSRREEGWVPMPRTRLTSSSWGG